MNAYERMGARLDRMARARRVAELEDTLAAAGARFKPGDRVRFAASAAGLPYAGELEGDVWEVRPPHGASAGQLVPFAGGPPAVPAEVRYLVSHTYGRTVLLQTQLAPADLISAAGERLAATLGPAPGK